MIYLLIPSKDLGASQPQMDLNVSNEFTVNFFHVKSRE